MHFIAIVNASSSQRLGIKPPHSDSQKDSKTSISSPRIESVILTNKGTVKYPYEDGK
ncbi:hypothetical protein T11_14127 [Trichinella zimbabwensis]|uniref:Uncharacterized protein n=1 Tax=Trichinella zimbabwensis TaxID=268475 RepID=A0A0V1GLB6_9BILA|nr:hypothetical protein T11_14127 [Trichinella zimbabwensis]